MLELKVGQKFRTPHAPDVFTLAAPVERVGGLYMLSVEERPDAMGLNLTDSVTLVH